MNDNRYTPALAAEICRRLSDGEPLRQICRDPGMPPESSVRTWARDKPEFAAQYHEARRLQIEAWADEIVEISNRDDLDPQDKRVRVDTMKWLMSKLVPRRYGDRLLMAGDPENPMQLLHHSVSLGHLTDAELEALEAFAQARLLAIPG